MVGKAQRARSQVGQPTDKGAVIVPKSSTKSDIEGFLAKLPVASEAGQGRLIGDASPRPWDARFRQFFDGLPAPVSGRDFSMSGIFRTAPTETTSIRGFSRDSWLTFKFLRATFVETINAAWSWPLSFSNRGRRSPRRSKIRCDNERSGRERVCLFQPTAAWINPPTQRLKIQA